MPKRLALLCAFFMGGLVSSEPAHAYWQINGVRLCQGTLIRTIEAVVPDSSEGAIVMWAEYNLGRVRRVDFAGRLRWDSCGVVVYVGSSHGADACSDGAGGAIIVWSQWQAGGSYRLLAQRVDGNGQLLWPSGGIPVCSAPGDQWVDDVIADGHGGAIIFWGDFRTDPSGDLYAQRLSQLGQAQWDQDGIPVCTAAGGQGGAEAALAEDGSTVVAWSDGRADASTGADVYAQRLSDQGVRLWSTAGIAMSRAEGGQGSVSIAPDGGGGGAPARRTMRDRTRGRPRAARAFHRIDHLAAQWRSIVGLAGPPVAVADGFGGAFVCAGNVQHVDSTTSIGPVGGFQ
jgi:hypothetical protein